MWGDVARAVLNCLSSERAVKNAYNIPGEMPLSFNQVIDTIAGFLGRNILKIHFPANPGVSILRTFERSGRHLPIKSEKIDCQNEDKVFGYAGASADFGYSPRSFAEGIRIELEEMGCKA